MRKSLLTVALFTTLSGFAQETNAYRCNGITKAGVQCKTSVKSSTQLCWRHDPNYVKKVIAASTICTSKTKVGLPCKVKTRHESGVCHHHRD